METRIKWFNQKSVSVLLCTTVNSYLLSRLPESAALKYFELFAKHFNKATRELALSVDNTCQNGTGRLIIENERDSKSWIKLAEQIQTSISGAIYPQFCGLDGFGVIVVVGRGDVLVGKTESHQILLGKIMTEIDSVSHYLRPTQVAVDLSMNPNKTIYKHRFYTPSGYKFLASCPQNYEPNHRYNYPVTLRPHNPENIVQTLKTISILQNDLGALLDNIEPIGSSTIPGIVSKPRIDIIASTKEGFSRELLSSLEKLGYQEVKLDSPLATARRFFRHDKPQKNLGINLHIINKASWEGSRERRLYRLLASVPQIAKVYSAAKEYLAWNSHEDARLYGIRKETFIRWLESDFAKECDHEERKQG